MQTSKVSKTFEVCMTDGTLIAARIAFFERNTHVAERCLVDN